jgi:hypothetical protein
MLSNISISLLFIHFRDNSRFAQVALAWPHLLAVPIEKPFSGPDPVPLNIINTDSPQERGKLFLVLESD